MLDHNAPPSTPIVPAAALATQLPEQMARLVDAAPVALIEWDVDGRVLAWNRAAEAIFRWSSAQVSGKPCPVLANAVEGRASAVRENALAGLRVEDEEIQVKRPDGTVVDVSLSAAPVMSGDGRPRSVVAAAIDVTERRQRMRQLTNEAESFRREARTDQLTGLLNRRGFLTELESHCEHSTDPHSADVLLWPTSVGSRTPTIATATASAISCSSMSRTRCERPRGRGT